MYRYSPVKKPIFRSIAELVIVGVIATAVPLGIAITNAAVKVTQLGRTAEQSVLQIAESTRDVESLSGELISIERNARQYAVLGEPALRGIYLKRHANALELLARLERFDMRSPTADELATIRGALDTLRRAIESGGSGDVLAGALNRFGVVHRAAEQIRESNRMVVQAKLASLSANAEEARTRLIVQSALLVALGVVLAALFIAAILRPLRRINQAITRLGEERYDQVIEVGGPSDLRKIGDRLAWLGSRLGELDDLKNEFMRQISHDLKTPLANIRESTALLRDGTVGQLDETQREIVAILDTSGARLTRLIDDLLDFSRWQEQHSTLSLKEFPLVRLVDEVVADHRLAVENRQLDLRIEVDTALTVTADEERMRTLFTNLLSNAVKFSPCGGTIELRAHLAHGELEIEMIDQGPGIPAEERELVFKPFYRGKRVQPKGAEGTGIGLALVEECVHAHGGNGRFLPVAEGAHFHASMPMPMVEGRS